MSDVMIRSTENGPNLVIVVGKVVQAWCRCGGSTLMPFCGDTQEKRVHRQNARGQGSLEKPVEDRAVESGCGGWVLAKDIES